MTDSTRSVRYVRAVDAGSAILRMVRPDIDVLARNRGHLSPRLLRLLVTGATQLTAEDKTLLENALLALEEWSFLTGPFVVGPALVEADRLALESRFEKAITDLESTLTALQLKSQHSK